MNQQFPDVSPSKGNLVKTILQNLTKSTKKTSSTIRWGKSFLIVQPLLAGILLFSGCNDPETLPVDVLPNGDELLTVFSDTSTIINRILVEDSLQTDELSASLLGNINDANFGVTTASIYTQVNLAGTPAFGTTPIADSLVLILGYDGYYGDTTESQTVNVYHLTSDLSTDSTYYAYSSFAYDPTPVGTKTFLPAPLSNVVLDSDTANKMAPHLRIRLDNSLADSILAQNGTVNLTTNTLWLAYFKGLKIEATPTASLGKGSISYFNFFNSALTIYFHNDTVPKKYNFSLLNARTNNFTHDYTGTPVETLLNSGTTDSLCYVSANGGVKTMISLPYLKHFVDSGSIVVNKAEIVVTPQGNVPANYPVPAKLLLTTRADNGTVIFPIDYYESSGYFGGTYNTTNNTYTFNIARQIQGILDGTYSSSDFYIVVSGAGVLSNRVILGSSTNPNYKMKLNLYYTKIN